MTQSCGSDNKGNGLDPSNNEHKPSKKAEFNWRLKSS